MAIGAGARSRWANIFTGIFFAILILLFGNLVELAAMLDVAAILIYVGYEIIDPVEIMQVWDTSWAARLVMIFTFLVTLVLSIQAAVLLVAVLSFLFHVITSASDVRVVELEQDKKCDFEQQKPTDELPEHKATLLTLLGGRFFAAAYKRGDLLPSDIKAQRAVAIIRLRGKDSIGSTFIQIMERYLATLQKNGGKLMFSSVSENVYEQLEKTEIIELLGEENVFPDSSKLLYSSKQALKAANTSLESAETETDEQTVSQEKKRHFHTESTYYQNLGVLIQFPNWLKIIPLVICLASVSGMHRLRFTSPQPSRESWTGYDKL